MDKPQMEARRIARDGAGERRVAVKEIAGEAELLDIERCSPGNVAHEQARG
jgi:hypothetical protein